MIANLVPPVNRYRVRAVFRLDNRVEEVEQSNVSGETRLSMIRFNMCLPLRVPPESVEPHINGEVFVFDGMERSLDSLMGEVPALEEPTVHISFLPAEAREPRDRPLIDREPIKRDREPEDASSGDGSSKEAAQFEASIKAAKLASLKEVASAVAVAEKLESAALAWNCAVCTFANVGGTACGMCESVRGNDGVSDGAAAAPEGSDEWSCATCTFLNAGMVVQCEVCQTDKPV